MEQVLRPEIYSKVKAVVDEIYPKLELLDGGSQHSGGGFTLSAGNGSWTVASDEGGEEYLYSGSTPSMCPADPRAAIAGEGRGREGQTSWSYGFNSTESEGIRLKCNKCVNK